MNNLKKFAKKNFYDHIESRIEDDSLNNRRNYWKTLKDLMNDFKSADSIPVLSRNINGIDEYYFTNQEKANCLNEYFTSVSNLDDSNTNLPPFESKVDMSLEHIQTEEQEIEKNIEILDAKKAVGPDLISHKVLKGVKYSISKPLSRLFNKSLRESIFPQSWKSALVLPLFKKGEKNSPSNYRPISLLSCIGKLMEGCVYKHMYNFLTSNNVIYPNQSGFLTGHSTVYQIISLYHQLVQSFDNKSQTCVIFCDISKAFDRVWHKGLVFKLKQNGIRGQLLDWMENYLSDRSQRVFIGTSYSRSERILAGVPQGSVLGPLLFLIYVNDITESLLSIVRLFEDDTSLACTTSNTVDLESILNHDLDIITKWSKQWLVTFNAAKTEVLYFGNQQPPVLNFNDTLLDVTDTHKHLGLTFSDNCKWHKHIDNIILSGSKLLGIMRKLKFTVRHKTLNQIYVSFLRPILEYASVVWDNCTFNEKDKLEKIQIEAGRIVTGLTRSTSLYNLFRELGWLTLSERRKYQNLVLAFKITHDMVPQYLSSLFPQNVGNSVSYNLRNNDDFVLLPCRTTLFENSCVPSLISLWNQLPLNLRHLPTISSFKREISNYIFQTNIVPSYFSHGTRYLSVIHARIRNNCSDLKNDLFLNHISFENSCAFCDEGEDAAHYFFKCSRYHNERLQLFNTLRHLHPLNCHLLLHGNTELPLDANILIFYTVHKYIAATGRFRMVN